MTKEMKKRRSGRSLKHHAGGKGDKNRMKKQDSHMSHKTHCGFKVVAPRTQITSILFWPLMVKDTAVTVEENDLH